MWRPTQLDFPFYEFSMIYCDFQRFSRNKHKRKKKEKPPIKNPWRSSDRFWLMREELFLVLELREEKITFTIVVRDKHYYESALSRRTAFKKLNSK